jgi:putative flippase GtrA
MHLFFKYTFIRFLLIGTLNTGFSYIIYVILLYCGLQYAIANFFALVSGIIFSFKTQGKFVFYNNNNKIFLRFFCIWIIIYFFNIFIIKSILDLGLNAYVSGAIAVIPVTIFSYFLQKFLVFKTIRLR